MTQIVKTAPRMLRLHAGDNVLVAVDGLAAGASATEGVVAAERIP